MRRIDGPTVAGNKNAIVNLSVPAEQRAIGNDHVMTDEGIVPHMAMGHEQIVRADLRGFTRFVRAMDRDMLANHIVLTDHHAGRLPGNLICRWQIADDAPGMDFRSGANLRLTGQIGVRSNGALLANFHRRINDGERANGRSISDLGARINDRRGVNHASAIEVTHSLQRNVIFALSCDLAPMIT